MDIIIFMQIRYKKITRKIFIRLHYMATSIIKGKIYTQVIKSLQLFYNSYVFNKNLAP